MTFRERIRALFAPQVTVIRTTSPMTPRQKAAFDRAFVKMNEAFAEIDKVFKP